MHKKSYFFVKSIKLKNVFKENCVDKMDDEKRQVVWEGEVFSDYTIDKAGQVYSTKNGKETKMMRIARTKFANNKKYVTIPIAQLMSNLFLDGKKVSHKDGDKNNNSLENLISLEKFPPIKKPRVIKEPKSRKLYHQKFDGSDPDEYLNIHEAALAIGKSERTVNDYANKGIDGWYFDGMIPPKSMSSLSKEKSIAVVLKSVNPSDNINWKFSSIRQAADDERVTISRKMLTRVINDGHPFLMNNIKCVFERDNGIPVVYKDTRTITVNSKGVIKIDKDGNRTEYKSQTDVVKDLDISNSVLNEIIIKGEQYKGCTYLSTGEQKIQKEIPLKIKILDTIIPQIDICDDEMTSCEDMKQTFKTMDEWKVIEGFDNYRISRQGTIMNKRGQEVAFNDTSEYLRVSLIKNDGTRPNKRVHCLVAETFIENPWPASFKLVNHINGNKRDNRADNLEWIDNRGNTIHAIHCLGCKRRGRAVVKTNEDDEVRIFDSLIEAARDAGVDTPHYFKKYIGTGKIYKFATWTYRDEYDMDDSGNWKVLPEFPMYRIYDTGKIWSTYFGRFLTPKINDEGYMSIDLVNKKGLSITNKVHHLVGKAFLDGQSDKRYQVNHIDNNPSNNNVENLEWCTPSENIQHAVEHGAKNLEQIAVYQRNKTTGEIIAKFDSMTKAATATGNTKSKISLACKTRGDSGGFKWDIEENKDKPIDVKVKTFTSNSVQVIQTFPNGETKIFCSQAEAAKEIGCSFASIHNACKDGTKFNNCLWAFGEKKAIQVVRKTTPGSHVSIVKIDNNGTETVFKTIADGARSIDPENVKNISANISATIKKGTNGKMYGFRWKKS